MTRFYLIETNEEVTDVANISTNDNASTVETHWTFDILNDSVPFVIAKKADVLDIFQKCKNPADIFHESMIEDAKKVIDAIGSFSKTGLYSSNHQLVRLGQKGLAKKLVPILQVLERSDKAHKDEGKPLPVPRQGSPAFPYIQELRSMILQCKTAYNGKESGRILALEETKSERILALEEESNKKDIDGVDLSADDNAPKTETHSTYEDAAVKNKSADDLKMAVEVAHRTEQLRSQLLQANTPKETAIYAVMVDHENPRNLLIERLIHDSCMFHVDMATTKKKIEIIHGEACLKEQDIDMGTPTTKTKQQIGFLHEKACLKERGIDMGDHDNPHTPPLNERVIPDSCESTSMDTPPPTTTKKSETLGGKACLDDQGVDDSDIFVMGDHDYSHALLMKRLIYDGSEAKMDTPDHFNPHEHLTKRLISEMENLDKPKRKTKIEIIQIDDDSDSE
jgi:hypothetical protein